MKNKPNQVAEVICDLCRFGKGVKLAGCIKDPKYCKPLQQALTKLGEIVERCLEKELEVKNSQMIGTIGFNEAIKISKTRLIQAGFLMKGGE